MSFADLALDKVLCKAIDEAFSIKSPTDIQTLVLKVLLGDEPCIRDILIRSKTGSGKTLAFCLPILHHLLRQRRAEEGRIEETPQRETIIQDSSGTKQPRVASRALGTLAIIVVPTRELALQTYEMLTKILAKLRGRDHWLVSTALSGGDRRKSEKERLRRGVHLVVGTPGRLLDHLQKTASWRPALAACRWLVVDEADRLLDSGFEKSMREIMGLVKECTGRTIPQMILCSATVDEQVKEVFGHTLYDPLLVTVKRGEGEGTKNASGRPNDQKNDRGQANSKSVTSQNSPIDSQVNPSNLEHFYCSTPTKFRLATLVGMLTEAYSSSAAISKVVLFTICCDTVDFLHGILAERTLNLLPTSVMLYRLHGGMEQRERLASYGAFSRERKRPALLICTDVAARGLNLVGVTEILQYDAPCDLVDYVHRAGRTARADVSDGNIDGGRSTLFLMPSERDYVALVQTKGLAPKSRPWEGIVHKYLSSQEILKPSARTANDEDEESASEEAEASTDGDLKRRNMAWLERLQGKIQQNHPVLLGLAQKAYLSFVRAYATHPAAEKTIFHPRKLHLGHLAATFLLAEAPKSVAMHTAGEAGPKRKAGLKPGRGTEPVSGRSKSGSSNSSTVSHKRKLPLSLRPARNVSEFSAGDALASFIQPHKNKKTK